MSCSSDDEIGNQVEEEYENKPSKKSHSKGLPSSERARIIADAINQKEDPNYKATNKNGKWYVRKRKVPLEHIDSGEIPPPKVSAQFEQTKVSGEKQDDPAPIDKKKELKKQFFTMQSTINEDLKKSLDLVNERCIKIEKKYEKLKREKAKRKIEREKRIKRKNVKFIDKNKPNEEPVEVEKAVEEEPSQKQIEQYIQRLPPFARGKFLNINDF